MSEDRIHRAISDDGTEIAGRVVGQGPPLVLVHGALEDGDFGWTEMLPLLQDRFTCYLLSSRGRGLSDASPDLSPERVVEDLTAFVHSIGEPVKLLGESGGGMYALGAAARCSAVAAVAVYEPIVFEVFGEENVAALQGLLKDVSAVNNEGRGAEAARMFAEPLMNDEELAEVSATDYFEQGERYVPVLIKEVEAGTRSHDYSATDPAELEQISAPVLVMHGSESATQPWFRDGAGYIEKYVRDVQVREIPGIGHWAPMLHPGLLADEVVQFFGSEKATA